MQLRSRSVASVSLGGKRVARWTASDIPPQHGRTVVVTGTGGLGFEDALALARAGAHVIVAGRSAVKGTEATDRIRHLVPGARVRFEVLDLASLDSIKSFSEQLGHSLQRVDVLINNAGVMTPPTRRVTTDGFELQLGTNYLGHFALTAHLLPLLRNGHAPRVVTLSSVAARRGSIHFDDLQSVQRYRPMVAYRQSKLACLMFAFELQRRSQVGGWDIQSLAAHPGISRTDLLPNGAGSLSAAAIGRRVLWFMFQPAAQGALPSLFAATSSEAEGGRYYGPNAFGEVRGYPAPARVPPQAQDTNTAARLWTESQRLTGVSFPRA